MKFALLLLFSMFIAMVTFANYTSMGEFWFARGSNSNLLIARTPIWTLGAGTAGVLIAIGIIYFHSESRPLLLLFLTFFIAVWIVSNRVLGIHPDGRVITGWFMCQTNTIDLRDFQEDYEAYVAHLQVRVSPGWTLVFSAHGKDTKIFVGPILWDSAIALLQARGFDVVRSPGA